MEDPIAQHALCWSVDDGAAAEVLQNSVSQNLMDNPGPRAARTMQVQKEFSHLKKFFIFSVDAKDRVEAKCAQPTCGNVLKMQPQSVYNLKRHYKSQHPSLVNELLVAIEGGSKRGRHFSSESSNAGVPGLSTHSLKKQRQSSMEATPKKFSPKQVLDLYYKFIAEDIVPDSLKDSERFRDFLKYLSLDLEVPPRRKLPMDIKMSNSDLKPQQFWQSQEYQPTEASLLEFPFASNLQAHYSPKNAGVSTLLSDLNSLESVMDSNCSTVDNQNSKEVEMPIPFISTLVEQQPETSEENAAFRKSTLTGGLVNGEQSNSQMSSKSDHLLSIYTSLMSQCLKSSNHQFASFGKYVGDKLLTIQHENSLQAKLCEKIINEALYMASMQMLQPECTINLANLSPSEKSKQSVAVDNREEMCKATVTESCTEKFRSIHSVDENVAKSTKSRASVMIADDERILCDPENGTPARENCQFAGDVDEEHQALSETLAFTNNVIGNESWVHDFPPKSLTETSRWRQPKSLKRKRAKQDNQDESEVLDPGISDIDFVSVGPDGSDYKPVFDPSSKIYRLNGLETELDHSIESAFSKRDSISLNHVMKLGRLLWKKHLSHSDDGSFDPNWLVQLLERHNFYIVRSTNQVKHREQVTASQPVLTIKQENKQ